ncbi:hypothetical protein NPX13_g9351 [Xylaria arbuscula]|uniref:Copper transport protein n=1 Tax=Xylaria arbuscula TaxID=114810 RepID=A0A9W8THJ9_9PEZI|nr:hypothetical protein NPX13_g9351 [Xylaria arbuscula]
MEHAQEQASHSEVEMGTLDNARSVLRQQVVRIPTAFRPIVMQRLIRALLYTLQYAVAYWIMLLATYNNGYVVICTIVGVFIGSFMLPRREEDIPYVRHFVTGSRIIRDTSGWAAGRADCAARNATRRPTKDGNANGGVLPTATDFSPSTQLQQQQQQQRQDSQSADQDRVMSEAGDTLPSEDGHDRSNSSMTLSESSQSPAGSSSTSLSSPLTTTTTTTDDSQSSCTVRNTEQPVRPAVDSFPENKSEIEVNFTMIYLDYVVPFLFPFYRPHLLESSRGWMLVLLMKNRALFHTALSLANWLYAVVFNSLDGQHEACRDANWAELQAHQEIAIKALQEDIKALNERGVANAFLETVSCMQSVIQLLEFEVAMADMSNWQVHHDVAVVVFDQLLSHHAVKPPTEGDATLPAQGPWSSILDRIGLPFHRIRLDGNRQILASDQTAFKFYTAASAPEVPHRALAGRQPCHKPW